MRAFACVVASVLARNSNNAVLVQDEANDVMKSLEPVLLMAQTMEAKEIPKVTGEAVTDGAHAGDAFTRSYHKLQMALTEVDAATESVKFTGKADTSDVLNIVKLAKADLDRGEAALKSANADADKQQNAYQQEHPMANQLEIPAELATATAMQRRSHSLLETVNHRLRGLPASKVDSGLKVKSASTKVEPAFLQDDEESLVESLGL